jgi:hypothetical protein
MTPYELSVAIQVYLVKQETEQKERLTLVWLGEYWHRIKKLPALKDILKMGEESKQMSDDDMLKTVKKLNSLFGGLTIKKEGESHGDS